MRPAQVLFLAPLLVVAACSDSKQEPQIESLEACVEQYGSVDSVRAEGASTAGAEYAVAVVGPYERMGLPFRATGCLCSASENVKIHYSFDPAAEAKDFKILRKNHCVGFEKVGVVRIWHKQSDDDVTYQTVWATRIES